MQLRCTAAEGGIGLLAVRHKIVACGALVRESGGDSVGWRRDLHPFPVHEHTTMIVPGKENKVEAQADHSGRASATSRTCPRQLGRSILGRPMATWGDSPSCTTECPSPPQHLLIAVVSTFVSGGARCTDAMAFNYTVENIPGVEQVLLSCQLLLRQDGMLVVNCPTPRGCSTVSL